MLDFRLGGGLVEQPCHRVSLDLVEHLLFLPLHGVDVLPVGEHVDGLVLFPEDDLATIRIQ